MSLIKPVGAAMPLRIAEAFSMAGKVVIITGAGGNVGSGIAEVFAANDAHVIVSDRPGEMLTRAADSLRKSGASVSECPADLTNPEQLKALVDCAVQKHARLDAIINCGAIPSSRPMADEDVPDFDRMFHTNVRSVWLLTKYAAQPMAAGGGGSIVNISSINGHRATFFCSLYAGTKAAVMAMTKEMAVELAPHNIRVNSVSPGAIPHVGRRGLWMKTLLNEPWASQFASEVESHHEDFPQMQPLQQVGHGHDVGMACYYLCTPAARFITGEDILVDGGKLMEMRDIEPRFHHAGSEKPSHWHDMKRRLLELPGNAWKGEKPVWLTRKK